MSVGSSAEAMGTVYHSEVETQKIIAALPRDVRRIWEITAMRNGGHLRKTEETGTGIPRVMYEEDGKGHVLRA